MGVQGKVRRRPLVRRLTALGVVTATMLCSTVTASAGADQALAQVSLPMQGASSGPSAAASDTLGSLGPGQSDTYAITAGNPTAGPLDDLTMLEVVPRGMSMVTDGQANLTGTGTAPLVESRQIGGTFQIVATFGIQSGWGTAVSGNAHEIRLTYGTVPANFSATVRVRAGRPTNGIGHDGVPISNGANIRTCITVSASANGTAVIPAGSCTDQVAAPLAVRFSNVRTSPPVVFAGAGVVWELGLGVEVISADDLVSPVIAVCLPLDVDLVDPSHLTSVANGSAAGLSPAPVLSRTPSGCGLDQVLLTWSWPAPFTLTRGSTGTLTVNTRVANSAGPALATSFATLTAGNLAVVVARTAALTVAVAPPPTCAGRDVTVDMNRGQAPTTGPDVVLGTPGTDLIGALGGDDIVCGRGGGDTVNGGPGRDRILGDVGHDTLRGGGGADQLTGGTGNDHLDGGTGADTCRGNTGNDKAVGCETTTGVP